MRSSPVLRIFGAVCIAVACLFGLVVAVMALSGGIRLRTPLGAMEEVVNNFDTDGFEVVASRSQGSRICFLQCSDWRYEVFVAPTTAGQLADCDALRDRASRWLEPGMREVMRSEPESYESPCYFVDEVPGHSNRRAYASLLSASDQNEQPTGATWSIRVNQD